MPWPVVPAFENAESMLHIKTKLESSHSTIPSKPGVSAQKPASGLRLVDENKAERFINESEQA
jgi:hypothetical protein